MESNHSTDLIQAFDKIYTSNDIQLLKLFMPYISPESKPIFAAYIKIRELSFCYAQIKEFSFNQFSLQITDLDSFIEMILPYCTPKQKDTFSQIKNIRHYIQLLDTIKPYLKQMENDENKDMSDLFQMFSQTSSPNKNYQNFFTGQMSDEQRNMFDKYKNQFDQIES